jgi:uncharacterized membrane protein (DUF485 family)
MIAFIVLAAIIASAALALHHYHWRCGATGQHVLAVLPAALLFVILPIPVLMFATIRGFKDIAAIGGNSYSTVAALSLEINRGLWLGSLGVLMTMVLAAILQWRASSANGDDVSEPRRTWRDRVLLACALFVVPAALVAYVAGEVPHVLMGAMDLVTGAPESRVSSSELGNLSVKISALLVTGFLGGLALAVIGLFAAAAAVFAASGIRQPRRVPRWGSWLLIVVLSGAAWSALWLPVERRWIERVAASAAQHGANLPR